MDSEAVKKNVLDDVYPDDAERNQNQELFQQIQEFIQDKFDVEARLMGSTAKDTFIAGDKDLDIFIFFPTDVSEDDLEKKGLEIGEAVFKQFDGDHEVDYAEHPYTKGHIQEYEVEIVPAYDVASGAEIQSSVDRTPFHTDWVNDQLARDEKKEVVVLKAFLRGQGLYGSTLRIEGFSGYLCELLIAEYGSFEAVLEAAVEWNEKQILDPAEHHETIPNYLKQKFEGEQLVMIDPVDPERNVASVLNNENYTRFVYAAWRYLQDPDTAFFFPEPEPASADAVANALDDRGDFVMIAFPTPDMIDDMLYPQLRSLMRRLEQVLEDNEFRLFQSGFHVGDESTRILFEFYCNELPATRRQIGPKPFHNTEHMANFTEKYGDVWVEGDRLVTLVERDHTAAEPLLNEFLSDGLQEKGVPKHLVSPVEEGTVSSIELDGEEWRRFLRDHFKLG